VYDQLRRIHVASILGIRRLIKLPKRVALDQYY
jgi:hypothetical protein